MDARAHFGIDLCTPFEAGPWQQFPSLFSEVKEIRNPMTKFDIRWRDSISDDEFGSHDFIHYFDVYIIAVILLPMTAIVMENYQTLGMCAGVIHAVA
jgi:hypothetical protein